jgi:hypothetical protein
MASSPRASKPSGDEAEMASCSTGLTVVPYERLVTMSTWQRGRKSGRMVSGGSLPQRDARWPAQVDGEASNKWYRDSGRAPLNGEIRTWRKVVARASRWCIDGKPRAIETSGLYRGDSVWKSCRIPRNRDLFPSVEAESCSVTAGKKRKGGWRVEPG